MALLKLVRCKIRDNVYYNLHEVFDPNKGLEPTKPSKNEIPVGGIISIGGKKYQVVEAERRANCFGCCFTLQGICQNDKNIPCSAYSRSDQTWVIFKEV